MLKIQKAKVIPMHQAHVQEKRLNVKMNELKIFLWNANRFSIKIHEV